MTWTQLENQRRVTAELATKSEIADLRTLAHTQFRDDVDKWLRKNHPSLI